MCQPKTLGLVLILRIQRLDLVSCSFIGKLGLLVVEVRPARWRGIWIREECVLKARVVVSARL